TRYRSNQSQRSSVIYTINRDVTGNCVGDIRKRSRGKEAECDRAMIGGYAARERSEPASIRVDRKSGDMVLVLIDDGKNPSVRPDGQKPRTVGGGNRWTHCRQRAGVRIDRKSGNVVGVPIADVGEASGTCHGDDTRAGASRRNATFRAELAGLLIHSKNGNAVGDSVGNERIVRGAIRRLRRSVTAAARRD